MFQILIDSLHNVRYSQWVRILQNLRKVKIILDFLTTKVMNRIWRYKNKENLRYRYRQYQNILNDIIIGVKLSFF